MHSYAVDRRHHGTANRVSAKLFSLAAQHRVGTFGNLCRGKKQSFPFGNRLSYRRSDRPRGICRGRRCGHDEKTREGLEMLLKKYHETLVNLGVTEFTPEVGTPFDPNTANAVMQMDGDEGEESGNIKQVFGRGYKLGEKVIRYAQVTVVK